MVRRPASFVPTGRTSTLGVSDRPKPSSTGRWGQMGGNDTAKRQAGGGQGMRPCATFRYVGPPMETEQARQLVGV